MTTFLKRLMLVAVAITFCAGMASAETVRVGIAAEPYPPFTNPDASGNWSGWEVDIINAICEEAKFDCVITPSRSVDLGTPVPGQIHQVLVDRSDTLRAGQLVASQGRGGHLKRIGDGSWPGTPRSGLDLSSPQPERQGHAARKL